MSFNEESCLVMDRTGYDPMTHTYHFHHNWAADTSITYTVLSTVAALTRNDPTDLDSISAVVAPDHLNSLFATRSDEGAPADCVVFTYSGCEVVIQRDGHIVVNLLDQPESNSH